MNTEAKEKWKARKKWKGHVVFYTEADPFNFTEVDPPAIIRPFRSKDIPEEFQNWSLVAEKFDEVVVRNGRRCCECLVAFLEESADVCLKAGVLGVFVNGPAIIASVVIYD